MLWRHGAGHGLRGTGLEHLGDPAIVPARCRSPQASFQRMVGTGGRNSRQSFNISGAAGSCGGARTFAITHVPYKGGGAAAAALVGGHVDMFFQNLSGVIGQSQAGTLRALFVTTPERVAAINDVPTVKEVGRPDLELAIGWSALYGPPGLPQNVVDKWVDVLSQVAKDKSWNKMTTKLGSIPAITSPAEMEAFAESQFKAMRAVAEATGMVITK